MEGVGHTTLRLPKKARSHPSEPDRAFMCSWLGLIFPVHTEGARKCQEFQPWRWAWPHMVPPMAVSRAIVCEALLTPRWLSREVTEFLPQVRAPCELAAAGLLPGFCTGSLM